MNMLVRGWHRRPLAGVVGGRVKQRALPLEPEKPEEDLDESFVPDDFIIPGLGHHTSEPVPSGVVHEFQSGNGSCILSPGSIAMSDALAERLLDEDSIEISEAETEFAEDPNETILITGEEEEQQQEEELF